MAIVFGKKKTKTPQTERKLTPWEKAQRVQKNSGNQNQKKTEKAQHHSFKFLNSRKKRIFVFGGTLIVLIVGGYLVSPLSKVETIKVSGNTHFSTAQIKEIGNIHKNDWIFPYLMGNRDKSKQVYKKQPKLLSYQVHRHGFNTLKITVKENMVAGLVFRNQKYYTILDNGKVIKKPTTQPSGDYPVFKNFHKTSVLNALLTQFKQLPPVVRSGISEIDYAPSKDNPNRLHLYMNDGNEVYAILPTFAAKMKYYPQMAADMKQSGVIDLEVGAYSYPFKNKSDETVKNSYNNSSTSKNSVSTVNGSSSTSGSSSSNSGYETSNSSSSGNTSSSSTSTVQATN